MGQANIARVLLPENDCRFVESSVVLDRSSRVTSKVSAIDTFSENSVEKWNPSQCFSIE